MSSIVTPSVIEKPSTSIDNLVLDSLIKFAQTEGQVIVHGILTTKLDEIYIRIWPTTFLFDMHSPHVSELVHFEKISAFPVWTLVPANHSFGFTLIFSALPKSCTIFNLKEIIPQADGFCILSIKRNENDVYLLDFT